MIQPTRISGGLAFATVVIGLFAATEVVGIFAVMGPTAITEPALAVANVILALMAAVTVAPVVGRQFYFIKLHQTSTYPHKFATITA